MNAARCGARACCVEIESAPSSSCPRLSRASTSFLRCLSKQDVDGRDEPGHDSGEVVQDDRKTPSVTRRYGANLQLTKVASGS